MRTPGTKLAGVTLGLALLASTFARATSGGAPLTMSHTGYLLGATDEPLSSTLAMKVRIYDAQGFGNVQWEGSCPSVKVSNGYYAVVLGSGECAGSDANGLDATLDTSDLPTTAARWMEVEVAGVTLTPRMAIGAVPTAAVASRALTADLLGTHPASDFALVSNLNGVATTGAYSDLSGRPTLGALAAKGSIADADVATDAAIAASKIAGLATVATSGSYTNLTGQPTLGALAAKGSIADADVAVGAAIAASKIDGLATVATSGSYNDLTNKPPEIASFSNTVTTGWPGTYTSLRQKWTRIGDLVVYTCMPIEGAVQASAYGGWVSATHAALGTPSWAKPTSVNVIGSPIGVNDTAPTADGSANVADGPFSRTMGLVISPTGYSFAGFGSLSGQTWTVWTQPYTAVYHLMD